jgi:hypothetical protein
VGSNSATSDLFARADVVRLQIEIPPSGIAILQTTEFGGGHVRPSVKATIKEAETIFADVDVHLKGWFGSFCR